MSKIKAVVLEKSGSNYIVLAENGAFRQVHRRQNAEVGEEIEISAGTLRFSGVRAWAGVAALFLMVLTAIFGWNLYQAPTAVALLSVDINPSMQFTIDAQGHLIKFQTQNEDAKRMLKQVNLVGKPIDQVVEEIVTLAYNQEFLNSEHHWVVVGYSPLTNKTLEEIPYKLNEDQIITWVTGTVEEKGFTPQVAVFPLTTQESEQAQKGNLTLGEYALLQTAQKAGVAVQPEKVKDTSERVQLLENPHVQAQIQLEKKELNSGGQQKTGLAGPDSGSKDKSLLEKAPASSDKSSSEKSKPNMRNENKDQNTDKDEGRNEEGKDRGQANSREDDKKSDIDNENRAEKKHNNYNFQRIPPIPTPENSQRDAFGQKSPRRTYSGEKSSNTDGKQR